MRMLSASQKMISTSFTHTNIQTKASIRAGIDLNNPFFIAGILLVIQLAVALLTDSMTLTQEESMWHYIGRNWLRHGMIPYSGGADNKSPIIFLVFGISDSLFGVNYWFPRILGLIVQAVGMLYLFKIVNQLSNRQAGIIALAIYGLSLAWKSTGGKYVSFTETYAVTGILVAYYYALTGHQYKHFMLGGLTAGIGLAFRISALFGIIAILYFLIRKGSKSFLTFLASAVATFLLILFVFKALAINLNELLHFGFLDNLRSGSVTDHSVSWKLENFANAFFYTDFVLFYPFLLTYFILGLPSRHLTIWLILEFAGIVVLGIFARNHFKHLLPVMSIMCGLSLNFLITRYGLPFTKVMIIVVLAFLPKTWEPFFALKKILSGTGHTLVRGCDISSTKPPEQVKKSLGLWIRSRLKVDESVYIAGTGSVIQAYSERVSPTIYFNATHTTKARDQLFSDLRTNNPSMILIPKFENYRKHVPLEIREFIAKKVSLHYSLDCCMSGYEIYQLKQ